MNKTQLFLALIISLASTASWNAATWRAQVEADRALGELRTTLETSQAETHRLQLAIADQNLAVAVAQAKTTAAEAAMRQAQQHAQGLALLSKSRMAKLDAAVKTATSCDQVLDRYWEIRQ